MTTDTFAKQTALSLEIDGRRITVGGMAKGSGMIAPNMATMLAVITTDAPLTSEACDAALRHAVAFTFNRVTVDMDTSTNDMCVLLASGAAGGDDIEPWRSRVRSRQGGDPRRRRRARADDRARRRGRHQARHRHGRQVPRQPQTPRRPRSRSRTHRSSRPRCSATTRTGDGSPARSAVRSRARPGHVRHRLRGHPRVPRRCGAWGSTRMKRSRRSSSPR